MSILGTELLGSSLLGGEADLIVPSAAIYITGYAPIFPEGPDIAVPTGALVITTTAPEFNTFVPPNASLSLVGYVPLVDHPIPTALISISTYTPLVEHDIAMAVMSITPFAPDAFLLTGVPVGNITAQGLVPLFPEGPDVYPPVAAPLVITGYATSLKLTAKLSHRTVYSLRQAAVHRMSYSLVERLEMYHRSIYDLEAFNTISADHRILYKLLFHVAHRMLYSLPPRLSTSHRAQYSLTDRVDVAHRNVYSIDAFNKVAKRHRTQYSILSISVLDITGVTELLLDTTSPGGLGNSITILNQSETDFDAVGPNGTFSGGVAYVGGDVGSTITFADGTVITIDAVVSGAVSEFTITTQGTSTIPFEAEQISTTGSGTGFTLRAGADNRQTVDGVIVGVAVAENSIRVFHDESDPHWVCDVSLADISDYVRFQQDDRFTLKLLGEEWSFVVDSKELRRDSPASMVASIHGVSPTILLDFPRADQYTQTFDTDITAKEAVEQALQTTVDWDLVDWIIPAHRLSAENASPLDFAVNIVQAAGGVLESQKDGSLRARHKYPASTVDYPGITPDHIFTEADKIIAITEQFVPGRVVNRLRITDGDANFNDVIEYVTDENVSSGLSGTLRVYPSPFRLAVSLQTTALVGDIALVPSVPLTHTRAVTDVNDDLLGELVEIKACEGNVSFPIDSIDSWEWISQDLGALTFEQGSTTVRVAGDSGYGLVRVKYNTKFLQYAVTANSAITAQFILEDTG